MLNAIALLLTILLMILNGCGSDKTVLRVVSADPIQLPPEAADEVAQVIEQENEYRMAAGQAPLVPGLVCTLHSVQSTTPASIPASPPAAVATFVYEGAFNQAETPASEGLNVLPEALRSIYTQWYVVKCQGQIVITNSDYHLFNLTSDDGSNLYLGGALLVNNDGNHSMQLRSGTKLLKRGVHAFRLDYMQGPAGSQGLILGDSEGVIPGALFYR